QVFSLKGAARAAMGLDPDDIVPAPAELAAPDRRSLVQGLYSGGTLCAETQVLFRAGGAAVRSNAPVPGVPHTKDANGGHPLLDLGEDKYTQGRPHPMIDPTVRDETLAAALADPATGVVLLDVVIGYGAHADPAGHLADVLEDRLASGGPLVVASVTGTDADPQVRSVQVDRLEAAGVRVAPTNADAAQWALAAVAAQG
ncbi:MAG: hypothetical protein VW405_10645, partial [Rhodospirillaceae bacterium]